MNGVRNVATHCWQCENCGGNRSERKPAGTLVCEECTQETYYRMVAVRLLIGEGSPYRREFFTCSKSREHFNRMSVRVTRIALLIRHGRIQIPNPLPMPRRKTHDEGAGERVAVGIYRALGTGARRRWDNNASRR